MGGKYEVFYYDYEVRAELGECFTNSFIKALLLVLKLEKQWYCVGIRFRRNRVKARRK